ncbi:MAG: NUDIX hydrolase [Gemmatimonadales bacterium]
MLQPLLDELERRPPRRAMGEQRPEAAVALIFVADPDRLLLILRAERADDPWSGHLALPGGRRHTSDADLLATAMRETREETGIALMRSWCRAELDDLIPLTPTLPPIMVRPFVFVAPAAGEPMPNTEVVTANWQPLSRLMAAGVYGNRTVDVRGAPRNVAGYQLDEGFLWGMTERILSPVLSRWKELQRG